MVVWVQAPAASDRRERAASARVALARARAAQVQVAPGQELVASVRPGSAVPVQPAPVQPVPVQPVPVQPVLVRAVPVLAASALPAESEVLALRRAAARQMAPAAARVAMADGAVVTTKAPWRHSSPARCPVTSPRRCRARSPRARPSCRPAASRVRQSRRRSTSADRPSTPRRWCVVSPMAAIKSCRRKARIWWESPCPLARKARSESGSGAGRFRPQASLCLPGPLAAMARTRHSEGGSGRQGGRRSRSAWPSCP